jgi:MFS transporter, FHS family, L-fucose permease
MRAKTVPVYLAFLSMGFGDVVWPLVGLVKNSFNVSNFQAQLMTFSGLIMFGVLSVPLGLLQDKKGKRFIMNLGLAIALIGLIVPIINGMYGPRIDLAGAGAIKFYVLFFAVLLLGAGATTLQVVGNPIMRDISPAGLYASNLSLAQSVKAVGSSLGFLVPPFAIKYLNLDWSILFPIYSILIFVNLLWFNAVKIEEKKSGEGKPASLVSCFSLLGNKYVLIMVAAIFFYVGAEVSMSSGVPILMKEKYGIAVFGLWVTWALFFLPILVGRFAGSLILRKMKPSSFYITTVILSIAGLLFMFLGIKLLTFLGIVMVGLGFANIFPLIFSITIERMPERTNELSGLMVMAIAGGAFIPLLMGLVADKTSLLIGFLVPFAAIVYILWTALVNLKKI